MKRAVDTVYQQVEENKDCKIYTFGPIIHNDEVIKDMQAKGVTVLEGEEDLPKAKNGIVIIRSHGVRNASVTEWMNWGFSTSMRPVHL